MLVHVGPAIGAFHFRALWFHGFVPFVSWTANGANEREWKLEN
jgi:hypothetical protein